MEFLPGRPLDYRTDMQTAAQIFGQIHQLKSLLTIFSFDHRVVAWEESAKQGERAALATVFDQVIFSGLFM